MGEKVIIALVVIVTLIAHWWIYQWIKFKIDEGTILNVLKEAQEASGSTSLAFEALATHTHISVKRVNAVCTKSKNIVSTQGSAEVTLAHKPKREDKD